ncbi:hypothetical protein AKJ16_DCAP00379 [Drosera capensis]
MAAYEGKKQTEELSQNLKGASALATGNSQARSDKMKMKLKKNKAHCGSMYGSSVRYAIGFLAGLPEPSSTPPPCGVGKKIESKITSEEGRGSRSKQTISTLVIFTFSGMEPYKQGPARMNHMNSITDNKTREENYNGQWSPTPINIFNYGGGGRRCGLPLFALYNQPQKRSPVDYFLLSPLIHFRIYP